MDLEFRKQWDKLVITLDVVDKDEESGTEVVHWVMHYPVCNGYFSFCYYSYRRVFLSFCKDYFYNFNCINCLCGDNLRGILEPLWKYMLNPNMQTTGVH